MRLVVFKRFLFSILAVSMVWVTSSCSNGISSTTAFSCIASATLISGTEYSNLTVTMSGGVGPYTLTLPLAGSSAVSSASATYSYPSTFTATSTTVTALDTSDNASTTCSLNGGTTAGTTGTVAVTGNITVNATPTTPVLGSPLTLIATDQIGLPNPTFTFQLGSNSSGVSLSGSGSTWVLTNSTQNTVVVVVYETVAGATAASATATVTLTYSGGSSTTGAPNPTMLGSIPCTLYNYGSSGASYPVNSQVLFEIQATATGEPLGVYYLIPGTEAWGAGFTNIPSLTNEWTSPFELTFSTAGQQTLQVWAQSLSRPGYLCNAGSPMTGVITLY